MSLYHPRLLLFLTVLSIVHPLGASTQQGSVTTSAPPGTTIPDPVPLKPEPIRVLLLDYHAPEEHDVLLSHLCVEPCRRSNACPDELVRQGVDYWSDDFVVFRPAYLGQGAAFVVDIYKERDIDLLSLSGHHASGFTGETGRGAFHTEALASQVGDLPGAATFFTHPAMVLLQGCRTDVKSRFVGDPVEYVLHVIQETRVRDDQFERLLAAVQQIGGVQEAYRDLFPNACLLGYSGTQAPGGRLEIFAQVHSLLRDLLPEGTTGGLDLGLSAARGEDGGLDALNQRVDRQCPRGWPCNLCAQDPAYRPLAANLARLLRAERRRVHTLGEARDEQQAVILEARLEQASYYSNTRWSCPSTPPGRAPIWPDPVDESPFGELFLRLLWMELEDFSPTQRRELRLELLHRLGAIAFRDEDAARLRDILHQDEGWRRLLTFQARDLLSLSTFRQQDFYNFLAAIACGDCLATTFRDGHPSLLRENAARALRPRVGPEIYGLALADTHPRVRAAAARNLTPELGPQLIARALADPDPTVRQAAEAALAQAAASEAKPTSPESAGESPPDQEY